MHSDSGDVQPRCLSDRKAAAEIRRDGLGLRRCLRDGDARLQPPDDAQKDVPAGAVLVIDALCYPDVRRALDRRPWRKEQLEAGLQDPHDLRTSAAEVN